MTPQITDAVIKACLDSMAEAVEGAASLAKAARACADAGNVDAAFKIALDIEPLLHEADYLIQAASTVRRRSNPVDE